MAAIYSNRGNRWNILGFNFTKRDALFYECKLFYVKEFLITDYSKAFCNAILAK
jgi:hypothetical protein